MTRGKQYVKKGVWYIGGGGGEEAKGWSNTNWALASIGASILGELANPTLKENFLVEDADEGED